MLFQKWRSGLKPLGTVHSIGIITALISVAVAVIIARKYRDRQSDRVYGNFSLERIPFQICTLELFFL